MKKDFFFLQERKISQSFSTFVDNFTKYLDIRGHCKYCGHSADTQKTISPPPSLSLSMSRLQNMDNVVEMPTMSWTFSSLGTRQARSQLRLDMRRSFYLIKNKTQYNELATIFIEPPFKNLYPIYV